MGILEFLDERIEYWKNQKSLLWECKSDRSRIDSKLNELRYIKKKINSQEFIPLCPNCLNRLQFLVSRVGYPEIKSLGMLGFPNKKKGILPFKEIVVKAKCPDCHKNYDVFFTFEKIVESESIIDIKREDFISSIINTTRRGLLNLFKGIKNKSTK